MFVAFMCVVSLVAGYLAWPSLTSLWALVGLPAPIGWFVASLFGHDDVAEEVAPHVTWGVEAHCARLATGWVAACHWAAANPATVLASAGAVALAFWLPEHVALGALVLVHGLPGSGKSTQVGLTDPVCVIPTGNAALDSALGIGGIPQGRLTTIAGDRGPQLARAIVAQAQQLGHVGCWVDCAGSLDLRELRGDGIGCARLFVSQPADKPALDIIRALVRSAQLGLVVVDQPPTTHASWARGLLSMAQDTKTTLVFLDADGVAAFHASVRLRAEHDSVLVAKNKYAPPYRRVPLDGATVQMTVEGPVKPHQDARPKGVEIRNH